jgi:hypothetical protein
VLGGSLCGAVVFRLLDVGVADDVVVESADVRSAVPERSRLVFAASAPDPVVDGVTTEPAPADTLGGTLGGTLGDGAPSEVGAPAGGTAYAIAIDPAGDGDATTVVNAKDAATAATAARRVGMVPLFRAAHHGAAGQQ